MKGSRAASRDMVMAVSDHRGHLEPTVFSGLLK